MKTPFVQHVQSAHSAQTVADETVIDSQPLTPSQNSRIASPVNSGDGNDPAPTPRQPLRSTLVDAVLDHLRETRMQKSRPH